MDVTLVSYSTISFYNVEVARKVVGRSTNLIGFLHRMLSLQDKSRFVCKIHLPASLADLWARCVWDASIS